MIIEANDIHKGYRSGLEWLRVIEGTDIAVAKGEFVAVVGESGAGKSTLLHIIGLLDKPDSGTIIMENIDTTTIDEKYRTNLRLRKIGFLFQFHHLLNDFTALENTVIPMLIAGESRTRARRRATELLRSVGLGDRAGHLPSQLSGGEQQRCALTRALANRPSLLIADEPTGNLDESNTDIMLNYIDELRGEYELSILIATHDKEVARRADRVLYLRGGTLHTRRDSDG